MIKYLKWIFNGMKYIHYNGFYCLLCSEYIKDDIKVPMYKTNKEENIMFGVCNKCSKETKEVRK